MSEADNFIEYFERHLEGVGSIPGEPKALYSSILYVAALDAMSKSVYPNTTSNRTRLTSFLEKFCVWPEYSQVSLPHLIEALRKSPEPEFVPLRDYVKTQYEKLNPPFNDILSVELLDPPLTEVQKHWPKGREQKFPFGLPLCYLQHYHLFYAFRNSLMHELRTPGLAFELDGRDKPYYFKLTSYNLSTEAGSVTTELVYPSGFCLRLCRNALKSLRDYFHTHGINPYNSYKFGTYWYEGLGED